MKNILWAFLIFFLSFSCGDKIKDKNSADQQAIGKAGFKTLKVLKLTYKFGEPDSSSAETLYTSEFNKNGFIIKIVFPSKIQTYGYREINKRTKLADIQELDSQALLQYQTNFDYADNGNITESRYSVEGEMQSKKVRLLDEFGRDTVVTHYNKKGAVDSKTMIRYIDSFLDEMIVYDGEGKVLSKTVCIAGDKDKRTFIQYNKTGSADISYTEYYDSDKRLIEYISNAENPATYKHVKYSYKDDLLYEEVYYLRNGEPVSMIRYNYDK